MLEQEGRGSRCVRRMHVVLVHHHGHAAEHALSRDPRLPRTGWRTYECERRVEKARATAVHAPAMR